jgi:adenylyltransferase/sulfurtransferase
VAVIGLGALGSVSSEQLVRAGVGFLRIVDRDYVGLSNLQRCALYTERDVAESLPKAHAARQHLAAINAQTVLEDVCTDVNPSTVEHLITDVDLVIDATDNFAVRFLLNEACHKLGKTWIYAGVLGGFGSMMVIPPTGPCFRCLSPTVPSPGSYPTCATAGVLAATTSTLASLQVAAALRLIVGDAPTAGTYVTMDVWSPSLDVVELQRDPQCPCCAREEYELLEGATGAPDAREDAAEGVRRSAQSVELCGRDEYQVLPAGAGAPAAATPAPAVDLVALGQRLRTQGAVTISPFILTFDNGKLRIKLFADGRAMIKGAKSAQAALSLYAEYIGL